MRQPVEHICLHCRIMYHIFEYDCFTFPQRMIKAPTPHVVTSQTATTAKPINMTARRSLLYSIGWQAFGTYYRRLIWHFQAIGHVTSKTDIQYGSFYSMIFHYIYHMRNKATRLPCKSATWLQYDVKMRITRMK